MILADISERSCLEYRSERKKYDCEGWLIAALIAGVVIGIGLGLFLFPFLRPLLALDGMATWVQAIGSSIGIGIAIFVPAWQHRKAEGLRNDEKRMSNFRVLRLLSILSTRAVSAVETIGASRNEEGGLEKREDRARQKIALQEIADEMNAIPFLEVPTYEAIEYFARLKRAIGEAIDRVEHEASSHKVLVTGETYGKPWHRIRGNLIEIQNVFAFQEKPYKPSELEPSLRAELYGD